MIFSNELQVYKYQFQILFFEAKNLTTIFQFFYYFDIVIFSI